MKIQFNDQCAVATITITSTLLERRKHLRVVNVARFSTLGIVAISGGTFFRKTVLSGKTRDVLRAYKTVLREAKQ
ncbi:hypothetical protein PU345_002121 [Enterobacter kobei]|nr:hypothetical protein [Enterobacter kobei]